jgi:hypothetical protein
LRPGPCINRWLRHSSSPTYNQVIVFHHHRSVPSQTSSSKHPLQGIQPHRTTTTSTTTPSMLIWTSSLWHTLSVLFLRPRLVHGTLHLFLLIIFTCGIVSRCRCRCLLSSQPLSRTVHS